MKLSAPFYIAFAIAGLIFSLTFVTSLGIVALACVSVGLLIDWVGRFIRVHQPANLHAVLGEHARGGDDELA